MLKFITKTIVKSAGFALTVCLCWPLGEVQPASAQQSEPSADSYRRLIDRYCVTCHDATLQTGGLRLDAIDLANVSEGAEVWEKVVQKIRTGDMPPADRPQLPAAAREALSPQGQSSTMPPPPLRTAEAQPCARRTSSL